jgi:activator of Hsp90 ATPase-like protein
VEIEWKPELKAEGPGRSTIELQPVGSAVKLTITHEIDRPESKLITAVSGGWPRVLSNLKSLLETGEIAITEAQHHVLRGGYDGLTRKGEVG